MSDEVEGRASAGQPSLDVELDQLFQLLPGALVEARGALADRLKQAGDKAGAARVKAIKRPTPAVWAINQVFFQQPALLQRALAQAEQVRALHAEDGVELRKLTAAVEAQRVATQAVVEAAMKLAQAAGLSGDAAQQRKILTTLQGWLSGTGDEPPGRMTHELAPSGFDAVLRVGAAPARPLPVSSPAPEAASRPNAKASVARPVAKASSATPEIARAPEPRKKKVDAFKLARAAELLARREQKAQQAAELVRVQSAAEAATRAELAEAEASVRAAEIALEERRAWHARQAAQLERAQLSLRAAQAAAEAAEAAAARARAEHAAVAGEQD